MKVNIGMGVAVLAIVISIAAIVSTVIVKPVSTISANSVGGNELADSSVTSGKVADGTITDADITDSGISKIADDAITSTQIASSSITLEHLTSAVIAAMIGVVDIANNSITGAKIVDGTITNVDISDSADIDPSKILGTAWTATNDGSGSGLDADTLDGINSGELIRNDSGTANYIPKFTGSTTIGNSVIYETAGGNVGIGTTSPTHKLDVNTDTDLDGIYLNDVDGTTKARLLRSFGGWAYFQLNDASGINKINLDSNGNSYFLGGNVGIGTGTPGEKLEVYESVIGALAIKINNPSAANGAYSALRFYEGTTLKSQLLVGSSGYTNYENHFQIKNLLDAPITFHTNNVEKMRLTSTGNLGIGTTNPTSKLHVIGKGTFTGGVDPPYVSFSKESHESIRQYARDVEDHEEAMQFWNGEAHRMEIYVISEDAFYTLTGDLVED